MKKTFSATDADFAAQNDAFETSGIEKRGEEIALAEEAVPAMGPIRIAPPTGETPPIFEIPSENGDTKADAGQTIHGTTAGDLLNGTTGDDIIFGEAGNDTINGDLGNDTIYAGADNDSVQAAIGNDFVLGEAGNDTLFGAAGNDSIYGGIGNDLIRGGDDQDLLFGEEGDDLIFGGNGNDTIFSDNSGAASNGRDTVYGNDGDDAIYTGSDELPGNDDDSAEGGNGNDFIDSSNGQDTVWGDNADGTGNGNDTLWLEDGNDLAYAGDGNDYVLGDNGNDTVYGGNGNDTLYGGDGNDNLQGQDGDDFIQADGGNDVVQGGGGNDTLFGFTGDDSITGGEGDDQIGGEDGNDTIHGQAGDDTIYGGDGNDSLTGDDPLLPTAASLISNGSFEEFSGRPLFLKDGGMQVQSMDNWVLQSGSGYALYTNGQHGVSTTDGDHWLNFDTIGGNLSISQQIPDLPFISYLSLDAALPIGGAGDTVEVWWNGVLLGVVDPSSTVMQEFNFILISSIGDGSSTLQLVGTGTSNGIGVAIDNIEVNFTQNHLASNAPDFLFGAQTTNDYIDGGNGNDTIHGYEQNDTVIGGSGNDEVYGDNGNDIVVGGTDTGTAARIGDTFTFTAGDQLIGGAGADTFMYNNVNQGVDQIRDFATGTDHVNLQGMGITDFADLQSHMVQTATGVALYFGTNSAIVFQGLQIADLHAGDFIF